MAAAVVTVGAVYGRSLGFDLFEDDYFLLRPWSAEHLVSVVSGPWLEPDLPDYFRPMAIYLYEALFFTFGLNTQVLHVWPLVVATAAASLLGGFVRRETSSTGLGASAAVMFALHPAAITAAGPWIANQYQGLVTVALLGSLLLWRRARARGWQAWLWLVPPSVVAALLKEPGLLLPVMILGAHVMRVWWCRDHAAPPWWAVSGGLLTFAGLNAWRAAALGGVGGTTAPLDLDWYWLERLAAPLWVVFVDPLSGTWPGRDEVFIAASLLMLGPALWAAVSRPTSPAARLVVTGAVVLAVASVPTSIEISRERLTPHDAGGVLIWAGGLAALTATLRRRGVLITAGIGAGVVAAVIGLSHRAVDQFNPCAGAQAHNPDLLFEEVRMPPPEMVQWLRDLPRPCRPELVVPIHKAVPHLTWGVVALDVGGGSVAWRWIESRVVALVRPTATTAEVSLRQAAASPGNPVDVRIVTSAGRTVDVRLTSPDWQTTKIPLAPAFLTWLRQMHRVEFHADPRQAPAIEMRWGTVNP